MGLEDPVQLGERCNQVRPLRCGFEILQTSVHLSDIAVIDRNKAYKEMRDKINKIVLNNST